MQSKTIRFGIVANGLHADEAFVDLAAAVLRAYGPPLDPVFFSSHAGLLEACNVGLCDAVWAPPLVAHELRFTDVRKPVAVVVREGGAFYYSALVVRTDRRGQPLGLHELAGKRVAWVSPRSAAGYVVPYLQLRALGYDPATYFGEQKFYFTHQRALQALALGEVDAAATYAHVGSDRSLRARHVHDAHIVMTAGPIPGDVVLTRDDLDPAFARALRGAVVDANGALARATGARRFDPAPALHVRAIERWNGLAHAIGVLGHRRPLTHEVATTM
ncbi:hypothetical protein BH09MYX1_BH09MYX1_39650 [soil metagenome]